MSDRTHRLLPPSPALSLAEEDAATLARLLDVLGRWQGLALQVYPEQGSRTDYVLRDVRRMGQPVVARADTLTDLLRQIR